MGSVLSALRLGAVHLRVADLQKQVDFYSRVLGFELADLLLILGAGLFESRCLALFGLRPATP